MIALHLAVLLFGLTGLFGKIITVPSFVLVWGRTFFATISLTAFLLYRKELKLAAINKRDFIFLIFMGFLLSLHWEAFFYSVQISSIAIGSLAFSTFPIFVTFLEPLLFKEKLKRKDVIAAVVVFIGLVILVPELKWSNLAFQGLFWGIVSGGTFALSSVLNRKLTSNYPAALVALVQKSVACLIFTPFAFSHLGEISSNNWLMLIILGVLCTAVAHTLFIHSLKSVTAQLAGVVSSLEPVYAIILGCIFLAEIPKFNEVVGGVIILVVTIYSTIMNNREKLSKTLA
ncbi:MAG: EamA family transporter [Proteobacteria bacterium]|nr:EamA family transporter [Pseudomonadota bacterium]